jgi:uncharacterized protein YceK
MRALAVIIAVALVAGCSGMQTGGSSGTSGNSGNSSDYRYWQHNDTSSWPSMQRHDDPRDLYFGG